MPASFAIVDTFLQAFASCREQLLAVEEGVDKQESGNADDGGEQYLVNLSQRLTHIVSNMFDERDVAAEKEVQGEVQYALAALVDERLLFAIQWPGRARWYEYLIEEQMFSTASAGREVFARIDRLGERRLNPSMRTQLSLVYLMLLQLGFRGEWRGQGEIESQPRQTLWQLMDARQQRARAFRPAYLQNISEKSGHRLASMRRWWWGITLAVAAYLLISTGVWMLLMQRFSSVLPTQVNTQVEVAAATEEKPPVVERAPVEEPPAPYTGPPFHPSHVPFAALISQ